MSLSTTYTKVETDYLLQKLESELATKTFVENTSISNITFGTLDINTVAKTVTTTGVYYARLGKSNINIPNTTLDFSSIIGTSEGNILLYINSSNVLSAIKTSSYVLNDDDKHLCILQFYLSLSGSILFNYVLFSNVEILRINGVNHNAYNTSKILDYKLRLEVGEKNANVRNTNILNGGLPKTYLSFETGYLDQDGTVKPSTFGRGITDYIPTANLISYVNENSLSLVSIFDANGVFCAFYDASNVFISALKYTDFQQVSASVLIPNSLILDGLIPPNATSVRFNLTNNTSRITLMYKSERYDKKVYSDLSEFALVKNASLPAKEVGYLKADGTIFTGSSSRYITDYYEIKNIKRIISGVWSIEDANSVYATVYDASKNIITTLADDVAIGSHEIIDTLIPRIANAKYIRFTVASSSGVAVVETWNNTKNTESKIQSANLVFDNGANGYYLSTSGVPTSAGWNRQVCDFVAIPDNVTAIHLFDCVAIYLTGYGVCAFYDENQNFISMHFANDLGLTNSTILKYRKVVDIPFNAKYIRCNYDRTGADYPDYCPNMIFEINYGKPIGYNSPLYRGKIAVCGGSFSRIKNSQEAKKLWQETLFCEIYNYGAGGRGFAYPNPTTDSVQTQVDTAMASGISFDCVVLWASTNDINNGVQVGSVNDYTLADSYATRTTQNGGINYCIKKIMDTKPLCRIYFFSSLRIFTSEFGYNPYSTSTNSAGFHFIDYINGQKSSTNRFNIPLLDMYQIGGVNEYNYTQFYQADSLHMNDAGYKRVGYIQAEFLRTGLGNI